MYCPSIFLRGKELSDEEKIVRNYKYSSLPKFIIIDIENPMRCFYEQVADMVNCEAELDFILDEIVTHIADINFYHQGIEALHAQIKQMHSHQIEFKNDGIILANATSQLAHAVMEQIEINKLYVSSGVFPYEHHGWLGTYTPIFRKNLEFV